MEPLTLCNLATAGVLTLLFVRGLAYAGAHTASAPAARAWSAVLLAWLALAIVLAALGAFAAGPGSTVPWIAVGIAVPTAAGGLLYARSPRLRELLDAVPLQWLVGVQLYRVLGVMFLVAYVDDRMPAEFAIPAGAGDILVGLAAPVVAVAMVRRGARARGLVVAWCAAGIGDLMMAVTLGFLTSPSAFQQLAFAEPNAEITRYPFVLVPVFAVPASILLHLLVLARLRRGGSAGMPHR